LHPQSGIPPGKYDPNAYLLNDVALIKIEAVTLPNLLPIEINTAPITPSNGRGLTFVGYGIAARNQEAQSGVLRKATMNVLRATSCKLKRPTNYTDAFCAISPNRETPCFGEFGHVSSPTIPLPARTTASSAPETHRFLPVGHRRWGRSADRPQRQTSWTLHAGHGRYVRQTIKGLGAQPTFTPNPQAFPLFRLCHSPH